MKTPRRTILAGCVLVMTSASSVITVGTAEANRGPCYSTDNSNRYSFVNDFGPNGGNWRRIDVYRKNGCHGQPILAGKVSSTTINGQVYITISAIDTNCDNIGITLYTHGPSVTAAVCGQPYQNKTVPLESFGNPKNFWVRVGGTTNSKALSFPI